MKLARSALEVQVSGVGDRGAPHLRSFDESIETGSPAGETQGRGRLLGAKEAEVGRERQIEEDRGQRKSLAGRLGHGARQGPHLRGAIRRIVGLDLYQPIRGSLPLGGTGQRRGRTRAPRRGGNRRCSPSSRRGGGIRTVRTGGVGGLDGPQEAAEASSCTWPRGQGKGKGKRACQRKRRSSEIEEACLSRRERRSGRGSTLREL